MLKLFYFISDVFPCWNKISWQSVACYGACRRRLACARELRPRWRKHIWQTAELSR